MSIYQTYHIKKFHQEFRAAHLPDLLRQYFSVFKTYLEDVNVEMNFEQFRLEFEERRDMVFGFGIQVTL